MVYVTLFPFKIYTKHFKFYFFFNRLKLYSKYENVWIIQFNLMTFYY